MKLYMDLTPFFLCYYVLSCDAEIFHSRFRFDAYDFNPYYESIYTKKEDSEKELLKNTPSSSEWMRIRNATALEYWRRDFEPIKKSLKHNDTFQSKDGVTRRIDKKKNSILSEHQSKTKQTLKSRFSRLFKNVTRTSPSMRAELHKEKREVNVKPILRQQATSDYRSTRITPMSAIKLQEAVDAEEGMDQMMSAYNVADELSQILKTFPNLNLTIETIGRTVEYKDIIIVKITESKGARFRATNDDKFSDDQPEKKIVFIVHGLSVMGIPFLPCLRRKSHFKKVLSFYFKHLDKFDIYLIPMANPDGYANVMNHIDFPWNKNVSPQAACRGVALDRNFDVAWNTTTSVSSCSQQYPGVSPFSEQETRAVRDVFHRYGHKIIAYINVHSGTFDANTFKGDAVLYPRGYSDSTTDDDKYVDLRGEIDEAMKNASFEAVSVYVDTLHSWYGKVSGTSVDYASTVYGVPFALEFVMQIYSEGPFQSKEQEDSTSDAALEEIWGRVINTVFTNIWKSLHVNDVK